MLFVPAAGRPKQSQRPGRQGKEEIRLFVEAGGSYLASAEVREWPRKRMVFLPVRRKPTARRVPSFSGPVRLTLAGHRIWQELKHRLFSPGGLRSSRQGIEYTRAASYEEALPKAPAAPIYL